MDDAHKLMERVERLSIPEPNSGCWLWTASYGTLGYPQINYRGKTKKVSRLVYEAFYDVSPGDLFVCHKCDTPACVNPSHLWLGTPSQNSMDRSRKGRGRNQDGEKHHNAILTAKQAKAIFDDPRTQTEIAKDFGVSRTAVSLIKIKTRWKSIHAETIDPC